MRGLYSIRVLCCALAVGSGAPIARANSDRSVSTSRQFIVYGSDAQLRGAVSDLAEQTKRSALEVLAVRDDWRIPIVVNAEAVQANVPELPPTSLRFSQTGAGLKLQLDLAIRSAPDPDAIQRELLRAVLLEIMYRDESGLAVGTEFVQPPDWLLDGLLALSAPDAAAGFADSLRTVARAGNISALDVYLRQSPSLLDSQSRLLYRAYAFALLKTLIDGQEGRRRLLRFVNELPRASTDVVGDFAKHFPGLVEAGPEGAKRWTSAIARLSASDGYGLWTCGESEHRLEQALRVEIAEAATVRVYALEHFPRFIQNPSAPAALARVNQQLLELSARANPLYQALVREYQEIAGLLTRRKTHRLALRLAHLQDARSEIVAGTQHIDDYMNWFEATQLGKESGAFAAYMKTAETLTEPEHRRRDPISVYLNAIEAQLGD